MHIPAKTKTSSMGQGHAPPAKGMRDLYVGLICGQVASMVWVGSDVALHR